MRTGGNVVVRAPAFYSNGTDYLTRVNQGIRLLDSQKLQLGTTDGTDVDLYHNGTNCIIDVNTGDLSFVMPAGNDINIPTDIGVTFGDDGEKSEGDGTDLSIASSGYIRFDADAIGFDRAPNADRYLFIEKDFGEMASASRYGMHIRPIASETTGSTAYVVTGVLSNPYIGGSGHTATNNQAWSDTAGLRGFDAAPLLASGSSGEMTGVAGFYARNTDKGSSSMTVVNQYGLYVESLTTGATDYAIYMAGTPIIHGALPAASAATNISLDGSNNFQQDTSSEIFKDDQADMEIDSNLLYQLTPRSWTWNEKSASNGLRDFGFVAQEVASVHPMLANWKGDEPWSNHWQRITTLLVAEVQGQNAKLEKLEELVATYKQNTEE